MKSRYFKYIEIDKLVLTNFLNQHHELKEYVDVNAPFYVRVSKKPYAGLIHTIISDNEDSANVSSKWKQLHVAARKIDAKKINKLSETQLVQMVGVEKTRLIKQITKDVCDKILNLKDLIKQPEKTIVQTLDRYHGLSDNAINISLIFNFFKQNVLCTSDTDFIKGLKYFLKKQNIDKQDINNIKIKYEGQLTLFSLCMWKIRNERLGK